MISQQEFKDLIVDLLHTTTTRWGALETPLDGYVGFDTVLEQQRRKFLKKGFEFNLMVVGERAADILTFYLFCSNPPLHLLRHVGRRHGRSSQGLYY